MTYFDAPIKGSGKGKKPVVSNEPDLFSVTPLPATPYKGVITTTGHSGTATSESRAIEEVITGEATKRQLIALSFLDQAGTNGLTWKEFDEVSGLNHHGRATSTLSSLHQTGRITRLTITRGHSLVYVLPCYIDGREISPNTNVNCVCGKSVRHSYNFCPYCGYKMSDLNTTI